MNTVVAVILAKERRVVARFVAAGALSRERAQSLQQLGLNRGVILRRLRERAVVRQASPDLYYVDEESWNAVRRMRRRAASVIAAVALAIIFAIVFGARRARAEQHSGAADFGSPQRHRDPQSLFLLENILSREKISVDLRGSVVSRLP